MIRENTQQSGKSFLRFKTKFCSEICCDWPAQQEGRQDGGTMFIRDIVLILYYIILYCYSVKGYSADS